MNKELVRKSFARGFETYNQHAKAQQTICKLLMEMISCRITTPPRLIVEIGCGTGFLSAELLASFPESQHFFNDLVPEAELSVAELAKGLVDKPIQFKAGDAENLDFPSQIDLLASASTFQWFEDFAAFCERIVLKISKNGLFAFSTFGMDNFKEISAVTHHGISYLSAADIEKTLTHHFNLLEMKEEKIVLYFDHPIDVLKHIRLTGVKGHLGQKWTKKELNCFVESYQAQFTVGNKQSLTYHPLYFVFQKKSF